MIGLKTPKYFKSHAFFIPQIHRMYRISNYRAHFILKMTKSHGMKAMFWAITVSCFSYILIILAAFIHIKSYHGFNFTPDSLETAMEFARVRNERPMRSCNYFSGHASEFEDWRPKRQTVETHDITSDDDTVRASEIISKIENIHLTISVIVFLIL